jgi:DNA-binding response OmpR family regulator
MSEQPGSTVVVLLTAEADSNALVAAYEAGADLVVRGAESRELAARVRALLRRRAVRDGHAA